MSESEKKQAPLVMEMPRSEDAERGVLSCFLQNPNELLDECRATLPEDAFYNVGNRSLYAELLAMREANKEIGRAHV